MPNPTNGIPLTNLAALAVISANDIWAIGSGLIGDESATATCIGTERRGVLFPVQMLDQKWITAWPAWQLSLQMMFGQ